MLHRFSQFLMTLYRGCRELPVSGYQDWAFEQVKVVFPFDSGVWLTGTLDEEGRGTVHTTHMYKIPPQVLAGWASVSQGRAVLTERVFRSPGVTFNCIAADEFGPELLAHSRRYHIEHLLATASVDAVSRLNELISVYRAAPDQPFSEEERRMQQAVVPHLAETWRINRMHHMNLAQNPSCGFARSAMTDGRGVLHVIDPGFSALLLGEWPDWRGPVLPDELVRAFGGRPGYFSGKTMVVDASEAGDFVTLRARRKAAQDDLTKREREVASHFASGRTYRDIAEALNLSPVTVRNHLNHIYAKLGVANKAQLIAALAAQQ